MGVGERVVDPDKESVEDLEEVGDVVGDVVDEGVLEGVSEREEESDEVEEGVGDRDGGLHDTKVALPETPAAPLVPPPATMKLVNVTDKAVLT